MKAAIYARVSSPSKEEKRQLDTQLKGCAQAAARDGCSVPSGFVFSEVHTGAELWNRPELTRIREGLIASHRIDALYVHSADRLSRDPIHLVIVLEEAERNGVDVRFVTQSFERSDEGMLVQYVKGYAAKLERELIRERTLRGKLSKVKGGKLLGTGVSLYGYYLRNGIRTINEIEAAVVRRIFEWAASGVSIREMARRLTDEGVPSPRGKDHWSKSTISRILHEPAYAGRAFSWRWIRQGSRVAERPRDEWIEMPGECSPAIVDEKTWGLVQERLKRNKDLASRNCSNEEHYLLRGHIKCGECRFPMWTDTRRRTGRVEHSYRCRGKTSHRRSTCRPGSRPWINSRRLDDWVWDCVCSFLTDPKVVQREVERLRSKPLSDGGCKAIKRAIAATKARQRGLIEALGDLGAEYDSANADGIRAKLLDELRKLESDEQRLECQMEQGRRELEQAQVALKRLDGVANWCKQVKSKLRTFGYKDKRLALEAVGAEVFVFGSSCNPRAELHLHIPGATSPVVMLTTS